MKAAIKNELRSTDSFFKTLIAETSGYFVRSKFATVPATGKQPCKEIGTGGPPDWLIASSHRTNPGAVKPLHFPNQDSYAIYVQGMDSGDPLAIVALMDGHGSNGHFISMLSCTHIVRYVLQNTDGLKQEKGENEWEAFFTDAFLAAENCCRAINMQMSGATGTVLVIKPNFIVQANVGDSLAIIITKDSTEMLTIEDKPSVESEAQRIKEHGGRVINLSGSLRVFPVGLAITRAIGDLDGRKYGIICTPHVVYRKVSGDELKMFVGSDGIWDEVTPEEVRTISSGKYSSAKHEKLIKNCQDKYSRSAGGYADDATLVELDLKDFLNL